jgi:hypothetical protein
MSRNLPKDAIPSENYPAAASFRLYDHSQRPLHLHRLSLCSRYGNGAYHPPALQMIPVNVSQDTPMQVWQV